MARTINEMPKALDKILWAATQIEIRPSGNVYAHYVQYVVREYDDWHKSEQIVYRNGFSDPLLLEGHEVDEFIDEILTKKWGV